MKTIALGGQQTRPANDRTAAQATGEAEEECHVAPPTPEEIRERCAEIQREWTPRERLKRAGFRNDPGRWQPPLVHAGDLDPYV